MQVLEEFEHCEADDGYIGECPRYIECENHVTFRQDKAVMQKHIRLRHETINSRLKNWRCLDERFRHGIINHLSCVRAVAVLTQLAIESGEGLFDCREYDNNLTDEDVCNLLGL